MKIYLSGPVSLNGTLDSEEIEKNVKVFQQEAEFFRNLGHEVLSPVELEKQDSWEDFMRLCIPMVCEVDLVAVLPGWGDSRGSIFEAIVANTVGVRILPVATARAIAN